jgi:hypothetical protein
MKASVKRGTTTLVEIAMRCGALCRPHPACYYKIDITPDSLTPCRYRVYGTGTKKVNLPCRQWNGVEATGSDAYVQHNWTYDHRIALGVTPLKLENQLRRDRRTATASEVYLQIDEL